MSDVAVLMPVLGRPENAAIVAESIAASWEKKTLEAVFICSPDDDEQIRACHEVLGIVSTEDKVLIAPWPVVRGDFARKTNLGLWSTDAPYVFCGADDLAFRKGWADRAIAHAIGTGHCFVATNDLGNPAVKAGRHATHPVVCRQYAEECGTIDAPGLIYHEGYWHQFCDNEATETAMWRGCFGFARDAVVEHLHPHWGKAETDATYELGQLHTEEDRAMFRSRKGLWK